MAKPEGKQVTGAAGERWMVSGLPALRRTCLPFFALSFVYLWLVVRPDLLYYSFGTVLPNAPSFATGRAFLKDALAVPGGPAAYLAGFLSQGYYYAWLGALIVVLAGFALAELSRRHLARAGFAHAAALAGLPAVLFFLIYSRYRHPLTICLVVSLGLLLSLIFERLPWRRSWVRGTACGLLAALGFWLGGGGTLLVFVVMTVIYTIFAHRSGKPFDAMRSGRVCSAHQQLPDVRQDGAQITRPRCDPPGPAAGDSRVPWLRLRSHASARWVEACLRKRKHGTQQDSVQGTPDESFIRRGGLAVAPALPASLVLAWALAEYVFLLPARQALLTLTPFTPTLTVGMDTFLIVLLSLLYGCVPLMVLLGFVARSAFGRRRREQSLRVKKTREKRKHKGKDRRQRTPVFRPLSSVLRSLLPVLRSPAVAPAVLLALGLYFSHDALRKPYVSSNYYSCQRQWDKILELGRHLPKNKNNVYVNHDISRALYHAGRLPYDMFCYAQDPQALLLTHERRESDLTQWKLSEIFLELGHVNMAEKLASELVTTKGPFGPALAELGWISIIKGSPATARVYLNVLTRDLIYRGRAQSLLYALDHGFTPEQTDHIEGIRSCLREETTGITGTEPLDEMLAALLARNPRNKMAFEYLMACYLLTGQVDKIVDNMGRLPGLGYSQIPTLYEEAILIHFGSQGRQIDLSRYAIRPETLRRYEAFVQLSNSMGPQNQSAVLNRLIRDFGTSYFFYSTFGRVGLTSF